MEELDTGLPLGSGVTNALAKVAFTSCLGGEEGRAFTLLSRTVQVVCLPHWRIKCSSGHILSRACLTSFCSAEKSPQNQILNKYISPIILLRKIKNQ